VKKLFGVDIEIVALVLMSLSYAAFNSAKCSLGACGALTAGDVFWQTLLGMATLSVVLTLVLDRLKFTKKWASEHQVGLVGLLVPVVGNVIVSVISGTPLTRVYPLAFVDSLIFAIGTIGLYTLLKLKK